MHNLSFNESLDTLFSVSQHATFSQDPSFFCIRVDGHLALHLHGASSLEERPATVLARTALSAAWLIVNG